MKYAFVFTLSVLLVNCSSIPEPPLSISSPYALTVDYSRSIEAAVNACKFSFANNEINSANFKDSTIGSRELLAVLVKVSRYADPGAITDKMASIGYRPASLKELLALAEEYPEAQQGATIVALSAACQMRTTNHSFRVSEFGPSIIGNSASPPSRGEMSWYFAFLGSSRNAGMIDLDIFSALVQKNPDLCACFVTK